MLSFFGNSPVEILVLLMGVKPLPVDTGNILSVDVPADERLKLISMMVSVVYCIHVYFLDFRKPYILVFRFFV